jgi:hypothetical protein
MRTCSRLARGFEMSCLACRELNDDSSLALDGSMMRGQAR